MLKDVEYPSIFSTLSLKGGKCRVEGFKTSLAKQLADQQVGQAA